jgi:hypothetical protein
MKQTDYLCGRFRRKAKLFDRWTKKAVEKKIDIPLEVYKTDLPLPSALKEKPSTKGFGPDTIQRSLT